MNINATIFGQLISFFIFVLFCMKFIWPPIIKVIKDRKKKIKNSMLILNQEKKRISKKKIKVSLKLKKAKKKYFEIIQKANLEKDLIIKNAIKKALLKKNKILNSSRIEISIEKKKAERYLKDNVILLAIQISELILKENINKNYNNKVIDQLVMDFKGLNYDKF
ncbi:MAG: F0F1 ATP synthase subunit B [Buchnera aphidicola (Periphyllus lyropictus)]|uniref:F0F1 ATP synthase subunit B n=1 Tax=Buchnera aphidicola TaxID=9 RepID=UPI001EC3DC28|nr:F0F1 ATP synthase subunit B [Buchnera aphidicola]NIH16801.1 F0F1 ATP synthase subunit B [Buchnera aphidicola (Periphyllus lyropictus)]USS94697.1 F0F1 ATP synthase subunit B [Buchnera aphidicola (Periphyllus lyropictus)]